MTDPANGGRHFALTPVRLSAMRRALTWLAQPGHRITSLSFLDDAEMRALRDWAGAQEFRKATPVIEHKGRRVHQDFDVCFPAPRTGAFNALASLLENAINAAAAAMSTSPLARDVALDDFAIQRYPPGSSGIGIHRDGKRYHGIVVIVTLDGDSRLFTCADRQGTGRRRVDDRPGRIVLLSAEGFARREGEDARPLHGVDRITGGRLSLGMRCAGLPQP